MDIVTLSAKQLEQLIKRSIKEAVAELKPNQKRFLGVDEVAELLNLSKKTIQNLTKDKTLPSIKLGSSVRYGVKDIEQALNLLKTK